MEQTIILENEISFKEKKLKDEQQRLEELKKQLEEEKLQLERERRQFESEYRVLEKRWQECEAYEKRVKKTQEDFQKKNQQERRLFDMKWKLLEEEAIKLGKEKDEIERKRRQYLFYERVRTYEKTCETEAALSGDLFYKGITNEIGLKRRYKDLIKIYHPDNAGGDNATMLEITSQYEKMKAQFQK